MVTSVKNGNLQVLTSDNMFMQLPTPLDCINRAPR
jgi:hypothetical protein